MMVGVVSMRTARQDAGAIASDCAGGPSDPSLVLWNKTHTTKVDRRDFGQGTVRGTYSLCCIVLYSYLLYSHHCYLYFFLVFRLTLPEVQQVLTNRYR
jgi:hypothetical protein